FVLATQLIGIGSILNVVMDVPKAIGCAIGMVVITVYFVAGGLVSSARVNVVQLAVKLSGFAVALPIALNTVGGWSGLGTLKTNDPEYWPFWRPDVAVGFMFAYIPAFIVSPGLLQKTLGARDDRAVRIGVGLNALGLFLYAPVPVLLGAAAHVLFPSLGDTQLALPMILMHAVPPLVGAIGLAAVFSAEVSAADAVLMILSTAFSQDLYKRFFAPEADDV